MLAKSNDIVILQHGFFRTRRNMRVLKANLERHGYKVFAFSLPTFFSPLEICADQLSAKIAGLSENGAGKIHFVGHSMGGLIIRLYLAEHSIPNLGRCVYIASPHAGTKLADLARNLFPPVTAIFQPLKSVTADRPEIKPPLNNPPPEIGIIAGKRITYGCGSLLPRPNDGLVEVYSAKLADMQDFALFDYHHWEIHFKPDVAGLIHHFLQTGKFNSSKQKNRH